MEKRKIWVYRLIPTFVLLVLSVIFFGRQYHLVNQGRNAIPAAVGFRSESEGPLRFSDIGKIPTAAGLSWQEGIVSDKMQADYYPANIGWTNPSFAEITSLEIYRGAYFVRSEYDPLNRVAVISDILAVKLFDTDDCVGASFRIGADEYQVCGVFRQDDSLLGQISRNELDTVYIPYREDICPELLYAQSKTQLIQSLEDSITQQTLRPPNYDMYSDYRDTQSLLEEMPRVSLFFFSLMAAVSLICVGTTQGKKAYQNRLSPRKRDCYLPAGICLGLIVGGILCVALGAFPLYLPPMVLPEDNIFDLGHYFQVILSAIQARNGFSGYDPIWNYSFGILFAGGASMLLACVFFLAFWLRAIRLLRALSHS